MVDLEISFCKAEITDKPLIQAWWNKPHVKEFWDNSPSMWTDCEEFLQGRKALFDYWVGYSIDQPYCLILTSGVNEGTPEHYLPWLEPKGETWTVDFLIGEEAFLGKGFAHITLKAFSKFVPKYVSSLLIDPAMSNPRAAHVYQKAGFVEVDQFIPDSGCWKGSPHRLMKMKLSG